MKAALLQGNRLHAAAVVAVLLGGFLLRLHASTTVPLMQTEHTWIRIAEALSFDPASLDLKGPGYNDHPMLQFYLMKLSNLLLGDSPAGWRFLNVCVGSLGLLAIYGLARMLAGRSAALAATILAAVNQFHVGWSRIAMMEIVMLTLATVSLILFWYALQTGRRWAVWLNGIVLGAGFLAKESMVLLPCAYFLFLLFSPKYRPWLRRPCVYGALLLAVLTVSHEIYWNLSGQSYSLRYVAGQAGEVGGISLRPASFFLGELIEPLVGEDAWTGKARGAEIWFPSFYEWPMMHWVEGLLLLGATASFFRRGLADWQKLMLTLFVFTAAVSMVIRTSLLYNPHYIPAPCLIPALLLAGCRLDQAMGRRWGRIAAAGVLVYLTVNVCCFVQIDRSSFKPPPVWKSFWHRPAEVTSQRMIVIGIDGTTPETLRRMIAQGTMPNLAALWQTGARAEMRVDAESLGCGNPDLPIIAPVFWTSVMTGCPPGVHRIDAAHHALSSRRRVPALWNMADYFGLRSVVTRVPGTYPPEPIWGVMIAAPPDFRFVEAAQFRRNPLTYPRSHRRDLPAADVSHGTDWTLRAHVFAVSDSSQPLEFYGNVDRRLGAFRRELDGRTWLVLVAGRGRGEAVVLIAGPGVRPGTQPATVSPLDVTPTVLYALGLPVFEHLEGEVLSGAFTDTFRAAHPVQTAPPCGFDRGWAFIDAMGLEAAADRAAGY